MKTDLSFIPIEDLLEEIIQRNDHVVFMGIKCLLGPPGQKPTIEYRRRWNGNAHMLCGMCEDLKLTILQKHQEDLKGKK